MKFSRRIFYKRRTRTIGEYSIVRKARFRVDSTKLDGTLSLMRRKREDRNVNLIEKTPLKLHWQEEATPKEAGANDES